MYLFRQCLDGIRFPETVVNDVLEGVVNSGINIEADALEMILPDPKDRVFYEVVMEERKNGRRKMHI